MENKGVIWAISSRWKLTNENVSFFFLFFWWVREEDVMLNGGIQQTWHSNLQIPRGVCVCGECLLRNTLSVCVL